MAGEKLSPQVLEKRAKYRRYLAPFVRTDINLPSNSGFQEAKRHVENGGGLILYAPHMDQVDPLVAYLPLYDLDQVFRDAPLVYPLAQHQGKLFGVNVPNFTEPKGVETKLIVTESTIKKRTKKLERKIKAVENSPFYSSPKAKQLALEKVKTSITIPEKNEGFEEFAKSAENALRNGGVVYAPVQPERSPKLEAPEEKPLGRLALLIKRKRIPNVAILVVGVTVDHPSRGGYNKARGLNIGKRHEVTIGPFLTIEDAVAQAGGDSRNLDQYMVEHVMAKLVPSDYLNPALQQKVSLDVYMERRARRFSEEKQ